MEQNIQSQTEAHENVQSVVSVDKFNWLKFIEKNFLALAILVAGVMISGSLLYSGKAGSGSGAAQIQQQPDAQGGTKVNVSIDDDPTLGDKNAKVVMIEFSDYQCPFCRTWWKDTFNQLKKEYIDTGKVFFVYRDFPLSFHPMAEPSAQASECANDQGKYWEFHDKLFGEQEKLGQGTVTFTNQDIKNWASQIGLNSAKFNQCLDSGKYKDEVAGDVSDGTAAGVSGTPSFFINGRLIVGAQPYSSFKAVIEEELKAKK